MQVTAHVLPLLVVAQASCLWPSLLAASVADLPVNQWVKLDTKKEAGYTYSQPVYVPSRGQVLHWGAVRMGDPRPWMRNDVRAFDAARLVWASDYPKAEKLPGLIGTSNSGKGVSNRGTGEMLPCGTPAPSLIANGVCYDPKRDQVIYTMKGLMAAYDPKARKWRDMGAKTLLDGGVATHGPRMAEHAPEPRALRGEFPGGPPVCGVGTGYDPVNDGIVLFPHWGGFDADLRPVTGELSAHLGTFVFDFGDGTWRRVRATLADGAPDLREARRNLLNEATSLSKLVDEAWVLRRHPDRNREDVVIEELAKRAVALVAPYRPAEKSVESAWRLGLQSLALLRKGITAVAVEPPARCGTPLVYDPKAKALVMFGGHSGLVRTDLDEAGHLGGGPGALNDTWLYDVTTKQWRALECKRRPPPTLWPKMAYDPASGLILLVTRTHPWADKRAPRVVTLWGLDVAKAEWSKLHEQPWTWDFSDAYATGWRPDPFEVALDEKAGLLLLTQNVSGNREPVEQVFALRLDVSKLKPEPAPEWVPPPPVKPIQIPPDDPAWVEKLKSLPPNTWVHAKPPREAHDRGWGVVACDPVRGWLVYFGGGHATYQVNNPDIYVVGANRWVTTAGDHNDWVPPVAWGGVAMGFRGGRHAHHQRNEYVALDGRMFWSIGTVSRRWGAEQGKEPGPRYSWFFDIDRGGVWRQVQIPKVTMGEGVPGTYGRPCVVFPDGRVVGFGGALEPYDGRFFEGENYIAIFDIYKNTLEMRKVPPPCPGIVYECRPFCALPDRNQVFFYECVLKDKKIARQRTWVYDIATNRFLDLKPKRQPDTPDEPGTVAYLEGQGAVFAAIGRDKQWVYSFERNTWAPLPLASDAKYEFDAVYTQLDYVAKYGVLASVGAASRGTAVMRPDVSAVRWE